MQSLLISATLLLALVVFVNAKPHHPLPPHKQVAFDACLTKLDLTREKLHELHHGKESDENDRDLSCFFSCVDKESGLMNEAGNIDREEALKDFPPFVPQENRTTMVDACYQQKGADDCETSKLYHTCVKKLMPHPPMHPELKKLYDDCKEKLGLTDEEIHKTMHSKGEMKKDCFRACLGKAIGFLNEDGTFNKEVFVEKSPPHIKDIAQTAADKCSKEEAADECETAALLHKCFKNNDLKVGDFFGPPPRPQHDE